MECWQTLKNSNKCHEVPLTFEIFVAPHFKTPYVNFFLRQTCLFYRLFVSFILFSCPVRNPFQLNKDFPTLQSKISSHKLYAAFVVTYLLTLIFKQYMQSKLHKQTTAFSLTHFFYLLIFFILSLSPHVLFVHSNKLLSFRIGHNLELDYALFSQLLLISFD